MCVCQYGMSVVKTTGNPFDRCISYFRQIIVHLMNQKKVISVRELVLRKTAEKHLHSLKFMGVNKPLEPDRGNSCEGNQIEELTLLMLLSFKIKIDILRENWNTAFLIYWAMPLFMCN